MKKLNVKVLDCEIYRDQNTEEPILRWNIKSFQSEHFTIKNGQYLSHKNKYIDLNRPKWGYSVGLFDITVGDIKVNDRNNFVLSTDIPVDILNTNTKQNIEEVCITFSFEVSEFTPGFTPVNVVTFKMAREKWLEKKAAEEELIRKESEEAQLFMDMILGDEDDV